MLALLLVLGLCPPASAVNGLSALGKQMLRGTMALPDDMDDALIFSAPMNGTLNAYGAGNTTPTFTRATVATHVAPSGVLVRDASGIPGFERNGYLSEGARTNLALWSDDLTNAAWVAVNATTAMTATGPDNVSNGATTVTATAGNATVLQTIVHVSSADSFSCWIKRRTGSGNIQLTEDGATFTTVSVTSSWAQFGTDNVTVVNPVCGLRIVTNGDAVDVCLCQLEVGAFHTSAIPTTSASVTRNQNTLTYPVTSNTPSNRCGAVYASEDIYAAGNSLTTSAVNTYDGSQRNGVQLGLSAERPELTMGDAAGPVAGSNNIISTDTLVNNSAKGMAASWCYGINTVASAGSSVKEQFQSGGVPGAHQALRIANNGSANQPLFGHVSNVMIFNATLGYEDLRYLAARTPR